MTQVTASWLIQNAASLLDKLINRWAAEVIKAPPAPLEAIAQAIFNDVAGAEIEGFEATPMVVQSLLRHALSETISEGIINCLIVTNSAEANVQLTRIHEHIFARESTSMVSLILLLNAFHRGPNCCVCMAPTDIFRCGRVLHTRNVSKYPHRAATEPNGNPQGRKSRLGQPIHSRQSIRLFSYAPWLKLQCWWYI